MDHLVSKLIRVLISSLIEIHDFLFHLEEYVKFFQMPKTREQAIQVRQICVDLQKSGNGYKKLGTSISLALISSQSKI